MKEKPNLMQYLISILFACIFFACSTTRKDDKAVYWKVPEKYVRYKDTTSAGSFHQQELTRIVGALNPQDLKQMIGTANVDQLQHSVQLPANPESTEEMIYLTNPSFYGIPNAGVTPKGWENYGSQRESPPDIQPGVFNILNAPKDGKTYLGLAYRDNGTLEAVGQKLPKPLLAGNQYSFSVWLANGPELTSVSRTTAKPVRFDTPIALQILGFDKETGLGIVLGASKPVNHTAWAEYRFTLEPEKTYAYFMLAALNPVDEPGNGYILVDACSPLVRIQKASESKN